MALWGRNDLLLLSEYWGQTTDLSSESGTDVLRSIRDQILYGRHDLVEEYLPVDQFAESWNLTSNSCPYLCLGIFEEFYEGWYQIPRYNLSINCLGNLFRRQQLSRVLSATYIPSQIYLRPYI